MHVPTPLSHAEHLMVLPVPLRRVSGPAGEQRLLLERQACNGLDRWSDNFDSLRVAAPVMPESHAAARRDIAWADVGTIPSIDRIDLVPLPKVHSMVGHLRHVGPVRALMRALIERATYLHFGVGGMWGGWGGIAAEEAYRMSRPYAVHLDWVEHEFVLRTARAKSLPRRLKSIWTARSMRRWHARLIERAALVMCHGADCYDGYRRLNRNAVLVHNIHTTADDHLSEARTAEKVERVRGVTPSSPLRVCYAGRMAPEKAPGDWIGAIEQAVKRHGVDVRATWLGDGPLRADVERRVDAAGLRDRVALPGFTADRQAVLDAIRAADVFLFTHVTPESPRCLIEALISATPVVGYDSHYPADLISNHGGGRLTPTGNVGKLAEALADLARDRATLADLVARARRDGDRFTSAAVFRHRSELMKKYLPALPAGAAPLLAASKAAMRAARAAEPFRIPPVVPRTTAGSGIAKVDAG
jgi:glycosyltransferase involved in cell wall biosynthesis